MRPFLLLTILLCVAACTKGGGFMSVFGGNGTTNEASPGGADPATLSKLARADLIDQLRGIAVTPGAGEDNGKGRGSGDYMLCASEQTKTDKVVVQGDDVGVRYEANADSCPGGMMTKPGTSLTGGTGFATFSYTMGCKGATVDVKGVKAAHFFRHQSFNFSGALEAKCLDAAKGEGSYRLESKVSYGYDVSDDGRNKRRVDVKTSLTVQGPDGAPCHVAQEAGAIVVRDCVYRSGTRIDNRPEGQGPSSLQAQSIATAQNLRAKAGERFYSSGVMLLTVNDWKGKAEFRNGGEAPVAELSNGREVVRVKLNGEFTDDAP